MTSSPDFEETRAAPQAHAGDTLPLGTRLRDYEITGLIGEGAFSIVYLGWDPTLQRKVAIKEYFPSSIAMRADDSPAVATPDRHLDTFKAGLAGFVNEARLLARFDHPSLVKVYRFWEENGTAYMAMPYLEGPTLRTALGELDHVPGEAELRIWLKPVLDALTVLHGARTWHQNIGPDAILLTPVGPVLLGFGAAAHAIESVRHTPAAALKPGFAAIEQYGSDAGTTRGPYTDLYALAATVYAAITGGAPAPAADRLAQDRVRPLSVVAAGLYSEGFLAAIDGAMAIQPQQRPADHAEFRAVMGDMEAPETVSLAPRRDLMQEPFLPPPDEDREVTVPDRPVVAVTEPPKAVPAPAPVATAPTPAPPATRVAPVADAPAGRPSPSWMASGQAPAASKRMLYGAIAGTCALIGIAALLLQFANRSGNRSPAVAAASPVDAASAAPIQRAAAPASAVLLPAAVVAPAVAAPVAVPAPVASTDPVQREARCIEILQKASLEKITVAETEFFKKECK